MVGSRCIREILSVRLSATRQPPRWRQYLSVSLPRYSVAPLQRHFRSAVMPPSYYLHDRGVQRVEDLRICLYLLVSPPKNSVGLPQFHSQNPVYSLLILVVVHWTLSLVGPPVDFLQCSLGQPQVDHWSPVILPSCSVQNCQPARLVLMS